MSLVKMRCGSMTFCWSSMARRLTPWVITTGLETVRPVVGERIFSCVYVQARMPGMAWIMAL